MREYGHMKTTMVLPDVTLRQARTAAAARGITLKQFVTVALEEQLRRHSPEPWNGSGEPPWMAGLGALSDLADENRRILKIIAEEFERLSPEDTP